MKTSIAVVGLGIALLGLIAVCADRRPGRSPNVIYHAEPRDRWPVQEMDTIQARLKAGQIDLAKAAELALPILQESPNYLATFKLCPGENDFHRACHFAMLLVEDDPQWGDFLEQYAKATGCRHRDRYAYDRLPLGSGNKD